MKSGAFSSPSLPVSWNRNISSNWSTTKSKFVEFSMSDCLTALTNPLTDRLIVAMIWWSDSSPSSYSSESISDWARFTSGSPPGCITAISHSEPASTIMPPWISLSNPQRTSDDLPLPDEPTTATKRCCCSESINSRTCSSRPKNR